MSLAAPGPRTHPPTNPWTGPVLCAAAMATVGTSVVASKVLAGAIEPFLATAMRHALALPLLGLLCLMWRVQWPRVGPRDAAVLLLQAAAGSVGYTVLLIAGTGLATAADAGVAAGTLPCMAALFAAVALRERPGWLAWGGIALATAGVMLLAAGSGGAASAPATPGRAWGIALVLMAVACEVLFILGQKRLSVTLPPLAMATLMSVGGLVLAAPVALARLMMSPDQAAAAAAVWGSLGTQPSAWLAVLWYAWVPTVLGFWLWYAGAQRASGTQAAVSTAVLPLVAVLGAVLVLGEGLSVHQGAALILVVLGVVLGSRPKRH